jgi:hypothetical protein
MSDETRDPRTDPRPGDVLDDARMTRIFVTRVGEEYIEFDIRGRVARSKWGEFTTDARVVARGAGARGGGMP